MLARNPDGSRADRFCAGQAENEAIALIEERKIQSILLDLMMRILNGTRVLKVIRSKSRTKSEIIPVIMIQRRHGRRQFSQIASSFQAPDDYLPKPSIRNDLGARIGGGRCAEQSLRTLENEYVGGARD